VSRYGSCACEYTHWSPRPNRLREPGRFEQLMHLLRPNAPPALLERVHFVSERHGS